MNIRKTICIAIAVALTGCATVSPQLTPNVSAPAAWNESDARSGVTVSADWWTTFGSPELQQLEPDSVGHDGFEQTFDHRLVRPVSWRSGGAGAAS